jgi:hypothetical protein
MFKKFSSKIRYLQNNEIIFIISKKIFIISIRNQQASLTIAHLLLLDNKNCTYIFFFHHLFNITHTLTIAHLLLLDNKIVAISSRVGHGKNFLKFKN